MGLKPQCFWTVLCLQVFVLQSCWCLSVQFLSQQPVHVVSGQNLLLKVQIDLPAGDRVTRVTWEHEAEGATSSGKTVVAEFPAKSSGGRVTVEEGGAVMKLLNFQRMDSGVYTVTVRDQRGGQESAHCTVHEYEAVHHVSVMVNVSHAVLHCREAWGTDPVFSWLHEKVAVTNAVGNLSADGSSLYLTSPFCGHFTCIVTNKLGHSSATYTADPCEKGTTNTAVVVVCVLLHLVLGGGLVYLIWRRHQRYHHRRERLQESYEDSEDPANRA